MAYQMEPEDDYFDLPSVHDDVEDVCEDMDVRAAFALEKAMQDYANWYGDEGLKQFVEGWFRWNVGGGTNH